MSEKENMVTKFSKIDLDGAMYSQEFKDEVQLDGLRMGLHLKSEEAEERELLDLHELETTNQEYQTELCKVSVELARLKHEKERWDDRMDKIVKDYTDLFDKVLTSQDQQMKKLKAFETFEKKVLEMVRRTRAVVEFPHVAAGGDEGKTSEEQDDDEIGNVVMVMAAPVEQELKKIEAAVAAAARRK